MSIDFLGIEESLVYFKDDCSYVQSVSLVQDCMSLWENVEWRIRKMTVHDFSHPVSYYVVKTTLDFSSMEALKLVGRKDFPKGELALPLEWRPKQYIVELDANDSTGKSLHVVKKIQTQILSLILLYKQIAAVEEEMLRTTGDIPECVYENFIWLISAPPMSLSTDMHSRFDPREFGPHLRGVHHSCPKDGCSGPRVWHELLASEKLRKLTILLTTGYIRCVLVDNISQNSVQVVKTMEVTAENPLHKHTWRKAHRVRELFDVSHWTMRRTISLQFSGDCSAVKCIAPLGAYLASSTILEKEKEPIKPQKQTDRVLLGPKHAFLELQQLGPRNFEVDPDGGWGYLENYPLAPEGRLEIKSANIDVICKKSELITPGAILVLLALLSQIFLLWHLRDSSLVVYNLWKNPKGPDVAVGSVDLFSPWITALSAGIPALALAYSVRHHKHPLLNGFTGRYRVLLAVVMILQVCGIGIAVMRIRFSEQAVLFCVSTSALVLVVFVDAMLQTWFEGRYYWRRKEFLKKYAEGSFSVKGIAINAWKLFLFILVPLIVIHVTSWVIGLLPGKGILGYLASNVLFVVFYFILGYLIIYRFVYFLSIRKAPRRRAHR